MSFCFTKALACVPARRALSSFRSRANWGENKQLDEAGGGGASHPRYVDFLLSLQFLFLVPIIQGRSQTEGP